MSSTVLSQERLDASSAGAQGLALPLNLASIILQIGVVVGVLVVLPGLAGLVFYDDVKLLVIGLVGLGTASLCLATAGSLAIDRTDLFLSLFLVVSLVSAVFVASDKWETLRTVGLTLSGAGVFWSVRYLASRGQQRPLLTAVAIAIILVAATVLLDALGYGLDFPRATVKGTQANRNCAAHLLALGMPLLALRSLAGLTAKRRALGLGALMFSATALVLTRSRAGWVTAIVSTALPLVLLTANSKLSHASAHTARCGAALGALIAGVLFAVLMPTKLQWSSPGPYLESLRDIVAYDRGSGQFRIKQDRRSLAMAADHPFLGVGPGNWRIFYPAYLPKKSPPRLWYPRKENNDWIGLAAERGLPAMIFFFATLVSLAIGCWRSFVSFGSSPSSWERSLEPLCAIEIMIALVVVGSLDAVLQLPAPTLIFFCAVGALAPQQETIASLSLSRWRRILGILMALTLAAILELYTLDQMYIDVLIARGRGDDLKVASRIAIDVDWFYNERLLFAFLEQTGQGVATGRI